MRKVIFINLLHMFSVNASKMRCNYFYVSTLWCVSFNLFISIIFWFTVLKNASCLGSNHLSIYIVSGKAQRECHLIDTALLKKPFDWFQLD